MITAVLVSFQRRPHTGLRRNYNIVLDKILALNSTIKLDIRN